MKSLINIRIKYILRHHCLLFWTYLFLPILILIAAIALLFQKEKMSPIPEFDSASLMDNNSKTINFTNPLLNKGLLGNFEPYWNGTILVVDKDIKDIECDKVLKFFQENANAELNCSNDENGITNETVNIIKINKKDERYRIDITSRFKNNTEEKNVEGFQPFFKEEDLDEEKITDLFFTSNVSKIEKYKLFFDLQSLLSGLLININNKNNTIIKYKEYSIALGYNYYPEHYPFTVKNSTLFCSFCCFVIVLQFSLIAYNFNMRIIDEKESKLNILLERQGISKFKYNLSWLITFFALFSFSILAFMIFLFSIIQFFYFVIVEFEF